MKTYRVDKYPYSPMTEELTMTQDEILDLIGKTQYPIWSLDKKSLVLYMRHEDLDYSVRFDSHDEMKELSALVAAIPGIKRSVPSYS